jgi:hypothetical protein
VIDNGWVGGCKVENEVSLELPEVLVCSIGTLDFADSRAQCHLLAEIGFFLVGFTVVGSVYPSEVSELGDR